MSLTYKKAGVDISKIKQSQKAIGKLISSTHKLQKKVKISHGFGHYAGIIEIPGGKMLATHTDGVGTKVVIANMMRKYNTIGIDCVAMNVNDIICIGATPISFVDYIAANKNDVPIFKKIVEGLVTGAKKSAMPIVGGETAIMPDVIEGKGFAFDLAGMVVGLVEKKDLILGNKIKTGDIIIGANSTGIHSNGYSLARKALLKKYSIKDKIKGVGMIGDELLKPTEIYTSPVLEMIQKCKINGLAHITGGAFTKLLRLKNIGYQIDSLPKIPPIMSLIQEQGVKSEEMYKTFNMGVGFCVVAPKSEATKITSIFKKHKISSQQIGQIVSKKGVSVNSTKIT
ncbi:MAG: phosphoribosylformylglycinamidine cyclo-ligase [Candidatus Nitrosopumilus limneticus]|nr:Phosphoribosylformylglycinamidine cyclo-ligase [Candidatus Nitrosopumilus limneticus]MDC4212615.1 phosphoribosylformylglycinamidine cyclo-ligase [Candidatus Nitrosopumilus limneticus]MDC4213126.1 phosphoribosylformylglycinamidine cyclo-ligase [Candidatus Nitrosopumilus limneticus]MDC4214243.1 phosphoribosylformylglycinamidine cyclo-ligase [Candidatus Nitrosopumilus limneticus]MDC4215955.1 phosphoribosylformylglycinamidine cyclo-ligase [Candidatus Nitrosopumilus limneticus]